MIRRCSAACSAYLLVLALAGSAYPQQRIEETVVVTGALLPVPFETLARTVRVVTREEIESLPVHSVAELLRCVKSLEVRSRGAQGAQADFSIRGAGFGQALILVNGIRINDAQTGHHNGDIPVLLQDIERVEILYGPGSSLYGADAFGGTINIITRKTAAPSYASVSVGSFTSVDGAARGGFEKGGIEQALGAWASRSSGFMFDRETATFGVSSQTRVGRRGSFLVSHLRKAFGANGFYGPAPSKEWTNQTLLAFEMDRPAGPGGRTLQAWYRTHGDHFVWDVARPGLFESRHRTHAFGTTFKTQRSIGRASRVTLGGELGSDVIRSSTLGNHAFARGSGFVELEQRVGALGAVYPGLRYDFYSNFGSSWSPSLAASTWIGPSVKIRSTVGRAFRVPTFTELYYRDPSHQASPELTPESAWGTEVGADWTATAGWLASATLFARWERSVIDWARETAQEPWRTTNLRRVRTAGIELSLQRRIATHGSAAAHYSYLSTDAGEVSLLSKYVLDYARHAVGGSGSLRLPADISIGGRVDHRRWVDGRRDWVVDARVSRPLGRASVYIECTNLLDAPYQEIRDVEMPGRWLKAGIEITGF